LLFRGLLARVLGMKVLLISSYPQEGGGISKYAHSLGDELARFHVEMIHRRVCFFQGKLRNLWFGIFRTTWQAKPDVVHIQYTPLVCGPLLPFFLFAMRLSSPGTKIVITAHEKPEIYLRYLKKWKLGWLFLLYEGFSYKVAHRIHVHTQEHREDLVARYHLANRKIEVIPHGIDEPHDVLPNRIQSLREKYGLQGRKVILRFGYIRPFRGLEYLIAAFPQVVREYADAVLMLAGATPASWAKYHRKLELLVTELDLSGKVEFSGYVPDEEIPALMGMAEMVVLPYMDITQSGVLHREVIAYAKPVVSTNVGGIGEMVRSYQIGRVVPPAEAESLGEAITGLLSDPAEMELYHDNALKARRELSWHNIAQLHLKVYEDVCR